MPCDKCNCHFSFWAIFLIFYHPLPCPPPPTAPKTKSSTKMKKPLEISSFYTSVPKIMIICYTVSMVCDRCNCYFILGYFLPFYPNNSPKNENFKKMKKSLEISSFYKSAPKIMIICYTVPEIWHVTHVNCYFSFGAIFCPFTP